MNPILVSNAYILESVQPETLEEPAGKSTILYANRFSGVEEVEMDEELAEILNSAIGTAGNNVLVQLKQKMQAYPGGPWYIDSNDGIVHIHNRKFTQKTAHVYTYLDEPGEVLSASFKIVEVYKQNTAGLAAYINAVNKAVSAILNPTVENPPERPFAEDPQKKMREDMNRRLICEKDNTYYRDRELVLQGEIAAQQAEMNRRRREEESRNAAYEREWNAKTPAQRQAFRNEKQNQAFDRAVESGLEAKVREAPEYKHLIIKWDYYVEMCNTYGSESAQAKKAWDEYKGAGADRAYISGIKTDAYWDWHEWDATVYSEYTIVLGGLSYDMYPNRQAAIMNKIATWKKSMGTKVRGEASIVSQGDWVTTQSYRSWRKLKSGNEERTEEITVVKETCKIRFKAYCLTAKPYNYPLSRLLGEYKSSASGVGNPMAAMQAAAANIGRAKKEKQLQANIRVVGNPELESAQQFIIQNVGKKYSGVWYIKAVSHSFEHGQGYICDVTLSKQLGKSKASGDGATVNTRNYTSGQGTSTTSKKGRPLANRVPSDNYTYQDAMNEQWTAEEALYIEHAVMQQETEQGARQALESQSYNIADKNMYNHQNNASTQYVTMGNGTVTGRYNYRYNDVKREKVQLPKQAMDVMKKWKQANGK